MFVNADPTVNAGNISVLTNWDLGQGTGSYDLATNTYSAYAGTYRVAATGEPGVLTLRAINDVVFDAAGISDGFYTFNQVGYSPYNTQYQTYRAQLYDYQIALANYDSNKAYFQGLGIGAPVAPTPPNYESYQSQVGQGPDSLLQESQMPASWGDSWSYRVVAGADFSSADPLTVQPVAAFAGAPGNGWQRHTDRTPDLLLHGGHRRSQQHGDRSNLRRLQPAQLLDHSHLCPGR